MLGQEALVVEVTAQEVGFGLDAAGAGLGSSLVGMEERARATGGRLRVEPHPDRGARVVAELAVGDRPSSGP